MEGFKYKSKKELEEQTKEISDTLGEDINPSKIEGRLDDISIEELKFKYPERYQIYLELLRKNKNDQTVDKEDIKDMYSWVRALNNLDDYIEKHTPHINEKDAREKRQLTVFEDIRDSLERGQKSGYVKLPTGVGKTVLFSQVVESLGLKSLIVVPSKILVGQTGDRFEEFTDVEFGKYFQEVKDYLKPVTITTYLSLIRGLKSGKIKPEEYGAIILDEVHKALGPKSVEAIKKFDCVKLGFTATPEYSNEKHVGDVLEHEIHSMSIIEAVQEGLISRFKSYLAYTETDFSKVKIKNGDRYDERDVEHTLNNKQRNLSAVQLYKEQFDGMRAVAYCSGIAHAVDLKNLFGEQGIEAEVISGSNTRDERESILERYKRGEIKVLCNAKLLIEGFDAPFASVCLNLHPTLSKVSAEQRAGRVLRLDPSNPEKWAHVVDFIDKNAEVSPITFPEIAQASEGSEEGVIDVDTINKTHPLGERRKYITDLEISGLKVVIDAQEVLRFSMNTAADRVFQFESEKFIRFDELKNEVFHAGIKTQEEYLSVYKEHKGWASNPQNYYGEWKGWPSFLSKEYREYLDFDTFRLQLISSGIKSSSEYFKVYKNYKGWPGSPHRVYEEKGWLGWDILLGKEKKEFLPFNELVKEVRLLGIKTKDEYQKEFKKRSNWPSVPQHMYKGQSWVGWSEFLGKEIISPFNEVKKEVKELKIESSTQYAKIVNDHPGWPSSPNHSYKGQGWVGWYDFLGKERPQWINLDQLKEEVKNVGITTQKQYQQESQNHPAWPSDPYTRFKNEGWSSWPDLFGKEYRKYLPFDEFKNDVRKARIKNKNQYRNACKLHEGWPYRVENVYKDKGWISWEDLFGNM